MNKQKIHELFTRLAAGNPKPTTELQYTTAFELLVAVTLSAQATDKGVNRATAKLFPHANTPQAIAALGVEGLSQYIRTIGLFNAKAKNIIATCHLLIERHGAEVPRTREALEALPGVGRKTANVILNTAFGEPTIAVDTHIFRVANRTGLAKAATVLAVEKKLLKAVPQEYMLDAHHWLILHGRYTCIARKPKCPECVIRDLCEFRQKTPAVEPKPVGKKSLHQLIASADKASDAVPRPIGKAKTSAKRVTPDTAQAKAVKSSAAARRGKTATN